jgi:type II restriction enzyme
LKTYQIKSQRILNLNRIVDGAYSSMIAATQSNTAPNLIILNYDPNWTVNNLIIVPSVFFTESVLEKRKPLGLHARRAGWVGCNFVLSNVPADGKIPLVQAQKILSPTTVRKAYRRYNQLEIIDWEVRGWTLDVLKIVRKLGKVEFRLADVYGYETELGLLRPHNRNIRPKIRQQLQVLRDLKILEFVGDGNYRLHHSALPLSVQ